jgi:hypothetical protein
VRSVLIWGCWGLFDRIFYCDTLFYYQLVGITT